MQQYLLAHCNGVATSNGDDQVITTYKPRISRKRFRKKLPKKHCTEKLALGAVITDVSDFQHGDPGEH